VAAPHVDFCSDECANNYLNWIRSDIAPSPEDTAFWNQYRLLQRELIAVLDYIAPTPNNLQVYSTQLLSLIRGIGAEVDSACKRIVPAAEPEKTTMADWRPYLEKEHMISRVCLPVLLFHHYVRPFREFELERSPVWWRAFTNLKHRRDEFFEQATLENAINALGGLLLLNVILLQPVFDKVWQFAFRRPHYSDLGITVELEEFFRLWGPGIETTTANGWNGPIRRFRIVRN
jgi:hypothetical protein